MRVCALLLALGLCVALQVHAHDDDDAHVEDDLEQLADEELLDGDDEEFEPEAEKKVVVAAAPKVRSAHIRLPGSTSHKTCSS